MSVDLTKPRADEHIARHLAREWGRMNSLALAPRLATWQWQERDAVRQGTLTLQGAANNGPIPARIRINGKSEETARSSISMNESKLLRHVRLGPSHPPTGKTRHCDMVGGSLRLPSELRIVQYGGDSCFYLLYCDVSGRALTDTYHDAIEGALSQAEWEFCAKPDEWEKSE
jgi:hypothetical protein